MAYTYMGKYGIHNYKKIYIKGDNMKDNKKTLIIVGIIILFVIIGIGLNSQDSVATKEKNMVKFNEVVQNITKNNESENNTESTAIENELVTTNTTENVVLKENNLAATTNNKDENPAVTTSNSNTNSNNSSKSTSANANSSSNKSSSTQVNSNKKVESNSSAINSKTNSNASVTTNKNDSMTVYITPTGKRYHYSPTCGGENSKPTTKADAIARGLTPCKKCAN